MSQGCEFDSWSGRRQESATECTDKWNNKSVFLSPSLLLSLCQINLKNPQNYGFVKLSLYVKKKYHHFWFAERADL